VNYYPFHIGDYASATRHLTWDEDAAYRRLLDVYYTLEKPIPADKAYRLAVAVSKAQREAVDTVLGEFFTQTPEGWRHERCEDELDAMRVKQAAQEAKDAHETDRMRRYRERRAGMFEALRAFNVVPAWDVPMKELQRLVDAHCNTTGNGPATDLQRVQVVSGDAPATAISTNTNTNTNTGIKKKSASALSPPADIERPSDVDAQVWADWLHLRKTKKAPVTATVLAGAQGEAAKAGMALEDFLRAWCRRGSQGLEASWLKPEEVNGRAACAPTNKQIALEQRNRAVGEEWLASQGDIHAVQ
jgi:uncharacterized protein YdaU (DUF1376 family)